MSEWKTVQFLDYVNVNPKVSLDKNTVYPYVDMANTGINCRMPNGYANCKPKSGARFELGDTIVARIEPCLQNGKGFYCKDIKKGFGSTEFLVFRPLNEKKMDSLFLYYLMKMSYIREAMANTMTGASGRQRVNNDVFKSLDIYIPLDLEIQHKIAITLSHYDTLIENYLAQIKLLEETAQRLYKEWFVDFHFPGYEKISMEFGVPKGWKKKQLADIIEFNPKYVVEKEIEKRFFPMSALSTSSMILDFNECAVVTSSAGTKFSNGDTLLARITPCLENGKTAYVFGLGENEVAVGSTEFIVMRSITLNSYMVYLLARSDNFRKTAINSMTGSDGRQRVQVDKLKLYSYLHPSQDIINAFAKVVQPSFKSAYKLSEQINKLAEARDRLLPKLMSGEINIDSLCNVQEHAQSVGSGLEVCNGRTGSPLPTDS